MTAKSSGMSREQVLAEGRMRPSAIAADRRLGEGGIGGVVEEAAA
jgi:hypothetical protein